MASQRAIDQKTSHRMTTAVFDAAKKQAANDYFLQQMKNGDQPGYEEVRRLVLRAILMERRRLQGSRKARTTPAT